MTLIEFVVALILLALWFCLDALETYLSGYNWYPKVMKALLIIGFWLFVIFFFFELRGRY